MFSDVDNKARLSLPPALSTASDITEVSEFRILLFWLQPRVLDANHVLISSIKEIFQKW